MQNCGFNMSFFNLNSVGNSVVQLQSFQKLIALTNHLQEVVLNQQVALQTLMTKQQQMEDKLDRSLKLQEDSLLGMKEEFERSNSAPVNINTDDLDEKPVVKSGIIRRNGFKALRSVEWNSQDESSSDTEKSKKRRNPSKAKHLWINYGRRIVEYAVEQTQGNMQERIRQLFGRLNSKKDFKEVFAVTSIDSEEDKQFKLELGQLAITFVKDKAANTFEGSKHKDQMISQRHTVAAWIEKLIQE